MWVRSGIALAAVMVLAGTAVASADASWSAALVDAPVSNALMTDEPSVPSCWAEQECVFVGSLIHPGDVTPFAAYIATQAADSVTAIEAPVPADASASDPYVQLLSVSCTSAAACVASGDYRVAAGSIHGLIETWDGTTWTAAAAPIRGAYGQASLSAVACSTTMCVITGSYRKSNATQDLLLDRQGSGDWQLRQVVNPVGTKHAFYFHSPSCPVTGVCHALADDANSGTRKPLLLRPAPSDWRATYFRAPAGVRAADLDLGALSCSTPHDCTAIAAYPAADPTGLAAESLTDGTMTATMIQVSSGSYSPGVVIDCATPTSCVGVVNDYSASYTTARFVREANGTRTVRAAPRPAGLEHSYSSLDGIACATSASCAAVGSASTASAQKLFVDTLANGKWTSAAVASPDPHHDDYVQFAGVDCVGHSCLASGTTEGGDDPFLANHALYATS